MSSAVVYTPLLASRNKRQYPVTTDQLNSLLAGASVVTFSSLTQALAPYLLISSLAPALAPYVLTSTLAATLATFPTLAGNNVWTGKQEFKDLPWADVTAWGAVSGQDSTVAIQAAIDHMNGTYGGGYVFLPPGAFITGSVGVTVHGGVILVGSGMRSTEVSGAGQDATVISFDGTCAFAGLRDIQVVGQLNTLAANNAVVVSVNAVVNMDNVVIAGGDYALANAGNSGRLYNVQAAGWNSGGVLTTGTNWYTNCQFDNGNVPTTYGFHRSLPAYPGELEDQITDCDFSGSYTYSFYADDGTAHTCRTKLVGCVFSSPIAVLNHSWTVFVGCELGSSTYSLTTVNPVTFVGNYQQGSSTVTLAGANVIKSANYQIA
jgi:hypothetical protein